MIFAGNVLDKLVERGPRWAHGGGAWLPTSDCWGPLEAAAALSPGVRGREVAPVPSSLRPGLAGNQV